MGETEGKSEHAIGGGGGKSWWEYYLKGLGVVEMLISNMDSKE